MKISLGCDEAAYQLKETIKQHLQEAGHEVIDNGVGEGEVELYPDVAVRTCKKVTDGTCDRGILVCGTGIVVPLDKSLPANELELLIERSDIEAIFYTKKYSEIIQNIRLSEKNKLKHLISMDNDENGEGIYSQKELIREGKKLIEEGNNEFLNAKINPKEMEIMLFTSGTTSKSKVVALSHENICTNLMDIGSVLDVNQEDVFLSILPIHHVFECTVGFLFSLYKGAETVFCDGLRHIVENLNEYHVTVMACVPGIYERIFMMIRKKLEKQVKLEKILEN